MLAYREISRAAEAISSLFRPGAKYCSELEETAEPLYLDASFEAALGSSSSAQGVLDEYDSKKVLAEAGIPTVPEEIVVDPSHAANIAEQFGYPVVLKGLLPGEVHKTEKGLVRLDIRTPEELRASYGELLADLNGEGRILIQKFIKADLEFICGMLRDQDFGPTVMFGMGGVMAEVYQDVTFRIAPFSAETAQNMMDSIEAKVVLDGFRGRKPVDRLEMARVLMQLGRIGVEYSQIAQIDINPLALVNGKLMALDATIIGE